MFDRTACDWTADATLVFVASTAFDAALMQRLAEACERLQAGARVLTLSLPLPSSMFVVQWTSSYRMSWGNVMVYLQQRKG
jgi:hypothetical protein